MEWLKGNATAKQAAHKKKAGKKAWRHVLPTEPRFVDVSLVGGRPAALEGPGDLCLLQRLATNLTAAPIAPSPSAYPAPKTTSMFDAQLRRGGARVEGPGIGLVGGMDSKGGDRR